MDEHTIIRWTALSHDGWAAECRCGRTVVGLDRVQAEERVDAHFNAETIGRPGLASAREALATGLNKEGE